MTASAADRSHSEKLKMTVSERSIGALTVALQDWLAGRSAGAGRPTGSGGRVPASGGVSRPAGPVEGRSAGRSTHPPPPPVPPGAPPARAGAGVPPPPPPAPRH